MELFRSTGAYLQGHFRLTSGLHSAEYLQCALVLQHPSAAENLGRQLAEQVRALTTEPIGVVVSPALGGLIIGHEVARALGTRFLFVPHVSFPDIPKVILSKGFPDTGKARAETQPRGGSFQPERECYSCE